MDWRRKFRRQSRRDHRTPGHRFADQDDRFLCPRFHARLPSSSSRSAPLLAYHRRTKTAIILRPGGFSLLATGNRHPRPAGGGRDRGAPDRQDLHLFKAVSESRVCLSGPPQRSGTGRKRTARFSSSPPVAHDH